jgi:hypothetical protein
MIAGGAFAAATVTSGTIAADTLALEMGAAATEPLAGTEATGAPPLTLLALAGGIETAEMARVLTGVC